MHPKNVFLSRPPNFSGLAKKYPNFRRHCSLGIGGKVCFDFHDNEAVRILSETLLVEYFGLDMNLPSTSLVPRIPQRLNYLLLIEDLLKANQLNRDVLGVDIGTGPSCIFPLLGTKIFQWSFVATELDDSTINLAKDNVSKNCMEDKINFIRSSSCNIFQDIFTDQNLKESSFTFSICNPPFFHPDENNEKFQFLGGCTFSNYSDDYSIVDQPNPPRSKTIAKEDELFFQGGEVVFVRKMIEESILFKNKIKIFTSMIGRHTSLQPLQIYLRNKSIIYNIYSIAQGRTTRWFIAWTFCKNITLPVLYNVPKTPVTPLSKFSFA